MLMLIFALVRAPDDGWGAARTIGELAAAAGLLLAFGVNEARQRHPLVPPSIFRLKGLAAADTSQVIAMAGFYSAFFFLTLYMQNVLDFSPMRAGSAYVPVALMVAISAGIGRYLADQLAARGARGAGRGGHGRIPPGAARQRRLPRGHGAHRAAGGQYPWRTDQRDHRRTGRRRRVAAHRAGCSR
jgi:hypothetical protein